MVKTPLKSSHIHREMLQNANFSYGYQSTLAVQVLVPLPWLPNTIDEMAKKPVISTVSPHRYTMCHGGSSRYGQEAGRKRMNLCLRPASAILIDVNSNYASCRGFQAQSDKMPCFQGFAGFHRVCRKIWTSRKALKTLGKTAFSDLRTVVVKQ